MIIRGTSTVGRTDLRTRGAGMGVFLIVLGVIALIASAAISNRLRI